jgi:undecaprenyl pyrophosphate phosphatase UppP
MKPLKPFFISLLFSFLALIQTVYASSSGHAYIFPSSLVEEMDVYFVVGGFLAAVVVGSVVFAIFYLKRNNS